uniref:RNA-directed DNA polymerase n=1 Tax=Strongyloides papillosus TaxID=174720 RepID=A0A0N5BQI9_STREA
MRLTSSGLAMSPEKLRKVMDFLIPQNKKTLLSFLGLANFLRRFLKNYTIDSKPLYNLSIQPTFTWTEQALESFQKVKKSLLEAPILTAPNFAKALDESWPFFLVTDASEIGIGAVLLQKMNGDMKIIAMFNRSLHGTISAALTHMNLILYGVPVTIITDHQCLTYIFSKPNLSTRLNKWKPHMQQYRIKTIKYMEGKSNFIADCLSRCLKVVETGNAEQFPAIQICSINRSFNWDFFSSRPEWQELQQRDEHIQLLYTFLDGTNKSNDITV